MSAFIWDRITGPISQKFNDYRTISHNYKPGNQNTNAFKELFKQDTKIINK